MNLRLRVTVATTIALAVGLAILGIALNFVLANRLSADASSVLRERAAAQVALLRSGDPPSVGMAWIFGPDGAVLQRRPADEQTTALAQALSGTTGPREVKVGEQLRMLGVPADDSGGRRLGTVVVTAALEPYQHTQRLVALGTFVLSLLVVAGGALLTWRAVGSALRPVAHMTEQAATWSEHDLDQRFNLGPPQDELTALAATLDALLGRLDAALRHEHRFSAEVAHELRTPLSALRAEAEYALRGDHTEQELLNALDKVLAGTDRMSRVIDTLMAGARGEASGPPGLSDAAATVRQLAGPGVVVVAPADPITVGADAQLVAAALQPLLENAERHALHEVRVEVRCGGTEAVIRVSDDGPGVAPEDAEQVFAPGFSRTGGAGLGLSLSQRLARAAGGEVVLAEGGFELRLPSPALP